MTVGLEQMPARQGCRLMLVALPMRLAARRLTRLYQEEPMLLADIDRTVSGRSGNEHGKGPLDGRGSMLFCLWSSGSSVAKLVATLALRWARQIVLDMEHLLPF